MANPANHDPTTEELLAMRRETMDKLELAQEYMQQCVSNHLQAGTWSEVTVRLNIEGGLIKDVTMGDVMTSRDARKRKIVTIQVGKP